MVRNKSLFFLFLVLVMTGACSTEETVLPVGKEILPFVLGEANPADSIRLQIGMVRNTSSSGASSVMPLKATVRILKNNGETLTILRSEDFIHWHAPNHLIPGEKYTLDILTADNKHITTRTSIPESFQAAIEKTFVAGSNRLDVSLHIIDKDLSGYFIIECVQKLPFQSSQMLLFLDSKDSQTDNYIYNELPVPAKHLFWRKKEKQQVLKLSVSLEKHCYLQIKKVDPVYYNYLYVCEVQHSNSALSGLLIANTSFLGIWGGCNTYSIPLSE